jgi:peptidylprolyl isomerase|tara:strand:+ start:108 stop:680 length:573 start_codon:yes stop_codon:yes gene_type:complete
MKVTTGHNVKVHYKGTLVDGTEFDNSRVRGETLDFEIGSGRMISGFNNAVSGMSVGQTKTFTLTPEDAYGQRNPNAFQPVPRTAFGPDFEFLVGETIQGNGPAGPFLAKIQELQEENVILDMNHPLAGEELTFEVELIEAAAATATTAAATTANWSASMKKAELLEVAKTRGLPVNTKSTKAQIIQALGA